MSLQTGARLATLTRAIIDPTNLNIVAYELEGPLLTEQPMFIRTSDIREYGQIGAIIDSNDELIGLDDVIKVKQLYELGFALVGASVVDEQGHKLGKVDDYTLETMPFVIQQLSVKHGFFKSLNDTGRLIHRSQIVEINDSSIVVKSPTVTVIEPVMQSVRTEFVNPFRTAQTQAEPESIETS